MEIIAGLCAVRWTTHPSCGFSRPTAKRAGACHWKMAYGDEYGADDGHVRCDREGQRRTEGGTPIHHGICQKLEMDTVIQYQHVLNSGLDKAPVALYSDSGKDESLIYCRWSCRLSRWLWKDKEIWLAWKWGIYGSGYTTKMGISFGRMMRNYHWRYPTWYNRVPYFQRKPFFLKPDRRQGGGYTLSSRGLSDSLIGHWIYLGSTLEIYLEYIWWSICIMMYLCNSMQFYAVCNLTSWIILTYSGTWHPSAGISGCIRGGPPRRQVPHHLCPKT